jgi:hypothetical protein
MMFVTSSRAINYEWNFPVGFVSLKFSVDCEVLKCVICFGYYGLEVASGILQPRTALTEQPTTRPGAESGAGSPDPKAVDS